MDTKITKSLLPLLVLLISGCASTSPSEPLQADFIKPVLPYSFTYPAPVKWLPVRFKVIEQDNVPYIALTTDDYRNLSLNMSEITRVLDSYKTTLTEIDKYYSQTDKEDQSK